MKYSLYVQQCLNKIYTNMFRVLFSERLFVISSCYTFMFGRKFNKIMKELKHRLYLAFLRALCF